MVEYALLVALVALIAIPAVSGLGKSVNSKYETATREVAGAGTIVTCNAQHPDWPDC
jgi:Flp pilus assembly pilin Flp